jgi:plasmid stabilization system protein ParE
VPQVSFRVRLTAEAEGDLDRLFDFVVERELQRDGGDLELAERALAAIRSGFATLKASPFSLQKGRAEPVPARAGHTLRTFGLRRAVRDRRPGRRRRSSPSAISSKTTTTDLAAAVARLTRWASSSRPTL